MRHSSLSQNRVLQQQQQQQQDLEDGSTNATIDTNETNTTVVPQNLPLLIGPIQVIPIADTLARDFIPPPYFVVEVDDGIETVRRKEEEELKSYKERQGRRMSSWCLGGLLSTTTTSMDSNTTTTPIRRYTKRHDMSNYWSIIQTKQRKKHNPLSLLVCTSTIVFLVMCLVRFQFFGISS